MLDCGSAPTYLLGYDVALEQQFGCRILGKLYVDIRPLQTLGRASSTFKSGRERTFCFAAVRAKQQTFPARLPSASDPLTQGYVHIDEGLRTAAERVSGRIANLLDGFHTRAASRDGRGPFIKLNVPAMLDCKAGTEVVT